ncbi:MAG: helix-turn-helix transcriptional regulator [Chloroflexota bacterium]|nr:helix-turn-helix transcriptional regulator [Chloroflexota bacterium]
MGQRGRPRHPDLLTPREQDVLALIRDGLTNEQIAEHLSIGFETAKSHVAEILSKLGVATREEAAAWQPEVERPWSFGRIVLPIAGIGVVAAAVIGVALLAWGIVESGTGSNALDGGIAGTIDADLSTCRSGLYSSTAPSDQPLSIWGRAVCWKDTSNEANYALDLTYTYAGCDDHGHEITSAPLTQSMRLPADTTWAVVPDPPSAEFVRPLDVTAHISALDESGKEIESNSLQLLGFLSINSSPLCGS